MRSRSSVVLLRRVWPLLVAAGAGAVVVLVLVAAHSLEVGDCRQVQGLMNIDRQALIERLHAIGEPGSASAHYTPLEKRKARQLDRRQLRLYHPRGCV